ncbi:MAG TPA: rod shape-determining protein RodA [bacterium]|jgi:rod shape determining protein RodA
MQLIHFRWDRFLGIQAILVALVGIGLVILATADEPWTISTLGHKQMIFLGLGILIMLALSNVDYRVIARFTWWIYGVSVGLLILVLVLGDIIGGSQRWFVLGPVNVQPSEFSKLTLVFAVSLTVTRLRDQVGWVWSSIACLFLIFPMFLLIFLQPDLGTALVYIAIWLGVLFVGGIPMRILTIYMLLMLLAVSATLPFLKEYQMRRITAFLHPENDPLGAGYQVIQSKIAVGNGGWFGQGLFAGSQNQLGFIPSEESDFIFAIACEELGIVGAIIILLGQFILILAGLAISRITDDQLGKCIAGGIIAMIAFQVVVNVGITLGLLPVTGIPLPFISYGGSALLTNFAGIGILISIYKHAATKGQMKLIRGV